MPENPGGDTRETYRTDECYGEEFSLSSHAPIIPHRR